jgi:CHAD domain-containing protein
LKTMIGELRRLQENLGEVHDVSVQQRMLAPLGTELAAGGTVPVETLLFMGRLSARLDMRQETARLAFAGRMDRFARRKNRRRFRRLFETRPERPRTP